VGRGEDIPCDKVSRAVTAMHTAGIVFDYAPESLINKTQIQNLLVPNSRAKLIVWHKRIAHYPYELEPQVIRNLKN
jgi:hypothetical protein